MIHEWRVYTCVPGKMPPLLDRFEKVALPIWKRIGIKHRGFWTVLIGPSSQELNYMLEWETLEEREAKWHDFHVDPAWIAGKAASEANGALVASVSNTILKPVKFTEPG